MQKAIIIILSLLTAYLAYDVYTSRNFLPPERVDELIDENTRVLSAEISTRESIIESITRESKRMAERIEEQDETIVALTEAAAWIDVYKDSLETLNRQFNLADIMRTGDDGQTAFIDTTLTATQTFTDELFEITCAVTFSSSGCISIDPDMRQLRETRIMHALTDRGSGYFNAYLHLPDFDMEKTLQFTYQPEPVPERTAWQQVQTALIWGGVAVAILKLIEIAL